MKLSQTVHDIQFPDIAVTGDGHVYVTYRQFADVRSNSKVDAIDYNVSTDCGASFSAPKMVQSFEPYDPTDLDNSGAVTGYCGDFAFHCQSGYTFMRGGTQVRSTADQHDASHDYLYVVYDPSIPGTEVPSGTTYGSVTSEDLPAQYHQNVGSQSGIYFLRLDGTTGMHTAPVLIDDPRGLGDARNLVGQPERSLLQPEAPDRKLRRRGHSPVARRVRSLRFDGDARLVAGNAGEQRNEQSELGAVRRQGVPVRG